MAGTSTDWEAIEREYRAGQLSIREIARQFDVSDRAIRKRAEKDSWERDLTGRVKEKIRAEMVRREVRARNARADEKEAVEAAASRGVEVLQLHRVDIQAMRALEQRLLAELGDEKNPPRKVWIGQFQGEVIERSYLIPTTERAAALNALANVQHKRIQLERQAFNLDDDTGSDGDLETAIMRARARIAERNANH